MFGRKEIAELPQPLPPILANTIELLRDRDAWSLHDDSRNDMLTHNQSKIVIYTHVCYRKEVTIWVPGGGSFQFNHEVSLEIGKLAQIIREYIALQHLEKYVEKEQR